MGDFEIKTVPILMLNWNGAKDTIECIESLELMYFEYFHVYLLDNGSQQEDYQTLLEHLSTKERLTILRSNENLGFAKGNNYLYQYLITNQIEFDFIALLNNDTSVAKNWLGALLHTAQNRTADLVSSKMVNYQDRRYMDNSGHRMINTGEIVPVAFGKPIGQADRVVPNFGPCAGACLISKKVLDALGLFDPYFETGYEDAEYGARAIIAGFKSYFAPKAIVYHKISQSVNKIRNYDYILRIQTNIFYSYFKLMPLPVIIISIPSFLIKYLFVIIIDILFWRPKYLRILFQTWKQILGPSRSDIKEARRSFFSNHKTISSFQILRMQEFFLWFDTKRFIQYVLLKKKSEFD